MFKPAIVALAAWVIFPSVADCRTAGPLPAPRPMISTHPDWPKSSMADAATIESTVKAFYSAISAPAGQPLDQDRLNSLFVPGGRIVISVPPRARTDASPGRDADVVFMTPGQYAVAFDRQNGSGFFDRNDANHTERFGVMAHVYSTYESRNAPADRKPAARGIKSFDLLNSGNRWRIVQVYWDTERPGNPIPEEYLHDRVL